MASCYPRLCERSLLCEEEWSFIRHAALYRAAHHRSLRPFLCHGFYPRSYRHHPRPLHCATSNIFAILGLRSLYFVLEECFSYFHLLHYGLALILAFAGIKLLVEPFIQIPIAASLGFICVVLAATMAFSKRP